MKPAEIIVILAGGYIAWKLLSNETAYGDAPSPPGQPRKPSDLSPLSPGAPTAKRDPTLGTAGGSGKGNTSGATAGSSGGGSPGGATTSPTVAGANPVPWQNQPGSPFYPTKPIASRVPSAPHFSARGSKTIDDYNEFGNNGQNPTPGNASNPNQGGSPGSDPYLRPL